MLELPKPKLADISGFTINCPDLELSLDFYKKLGFTELFRGDFPFKLVEVTDGQIQIMLRQSPTLYFALTYYPKNIDAVAEMMESAGVEFWEKTNAETDYLKRFITTTPEGLNLSLVMYVDAFSQPPGPTMLTMPQADLFEPEKYVNKTIGLFGEVAIPSPDLEASILYWQALGFTTLSKFESPYPWAIISDGLNAVGLHQTDAFNYPAITYFAVDMRQRIEALKEKGLTPHIEKDDGNITLLTAEGQHINLYTLGM